MPLTQDEIIDRITGTTPLMIGSTRQVEGNRIITVSEYELDEYLKCQEPSHINRTWVCGECPTDTYAELTGGIYRPRPTSDYDLWQGEERALWNDFEMGAFLWTRNRMEPSEFISIMSDSLAQSLMSWTTVDYRGFMACHKNKNRYDESVRFWLDEIWEAVDFRMQMWCKGKEWDWTEEDLGYLKSVPEEVELGDGRHSWTNTAQRFVGDKIAQTTSPCYKEHIEWREEIKNSLDGWPYSEDNPVPTYEEWRYFLTHPI